MTQKHIGENKGEGMNEWISTLDRLPSLDDGLHDMPKKYVIRFNDGLITASTYTSEMDGWEYFNVTHWMLLPEYP